MANSVKVDLVQHVGRMYSPKFGCEIEVEQNQWIVMASVNDGPAIQVGYLCKHEGAPLNGIAEMRALPAGVQDAIRDEAQKQAGHKVGKLYVPPAPVLTGEDEE